MKREDAISYFNNLAPTRDVWKRKNWYYHSTIENLFRFFIPHGSSVIEIGAGTGDLLASLKPSRGLGIDISPAMVARAREKYPHISWQAQDAETFSLQEQFDYVIASDLTGYLDDIEAALQRMRYVSHEHTRIILSYYNYVWEPIIICAERIGLKVRQPVQNWVAPKDVENLLHLAGFEVIKTGTRMLMPVWIPVVSQCINRFVAHMPFLSRFGLIHYTVARPYARREKDFSVSIVIPARNERGNIERAIKEIPHFSISQEIIFVEGHSLDGTLEEIKRVIDAYAGSQTIRWTVQDGEGKGDAVRKGFAIAKGDVLMILDADLTVPPKELPKFYAALVSGKGEFINGSRLVYHLEKDSMRLLNIFGNKFFSLVFSWLLGQRIKDTLCGTKVLFKKDYERIAAGRAYFGDFDPFGDFDLLFGAAKLNLKIIEMPVRYQARAYGRTNIQRWKHGWLLLKMTWFALWKLTFNP